MSVKIEFSVLQLSLLRNEIKNHQQQLRAQFLFHSLRVCSLVKVTQEGDGLTCCKASVATLKNLEEEIVLCQDF